MAIIREKMSAGEHVGVRATMKNCLPETMSLNRAKLRVHQRRPIEWEKDKVTGLLVPVAFKDIGEPEEVWNLITRVGRAFIHSQAYGTAGLGACGLNYIALSDDAVGETDASTTLSNEIAANGLTRAQGTVTLATGTGTITTVNKIFTCITNPQACKKAALFTAGSSGTMNHVLGFTERSLQVNDTIELTFSLTIA